MKLMVNTYLDAYNTLVHLTLNADLSIYSLINITHNFPNIDWVPSFGKIASLVTSRYDNYNTTVIMCIQLLSKLYGYHLELHKVGPVTGPHDLENSISLLYKYTEKLNIAGYQFREAKNNYNNLIDSSPILTALARHGHLHVFAG